jgi:hypothetical protein
MLQIPRMNFRIFPLQNNDSKTNLLRLLSKKTLHFNLSLLLLIWKLDLFCVSNFPIQFVAPVAILQNVKFIPLTFQKRAVSNWSLLLLSESGNIFWLQNSHQAKLVSVLFICRISKLLELVLKRHFVLTVVFSFTCKSDTFFKLKIPALICYVRFKIY